MKYYVASNYELSKLYNTIEEAREVVQEDINKGARRDLFIVEIVEAYKIKVPVEVSVLTKEDMTTYLEQIKNNKSAYDLSLN